MRESFVLWKVGDKVECIKDCVAWCCHMNGICPMKGQVFTIASFENTATGDPGINLQEMPIKPCTTVGITTGAITIIDFGRPKSVSWPVTYFRKLIEDEEKKVDHVAVLKKMAEEMPAPPSIAPTKAPETVD